MESCNVCDGTSFELVAGFYYCSVCNTQATKVELEHDTYFGHIDNRLNKSKQIVNKSSEGTEITSWEEFNYILVGLVDQLIELGAKPELKLTALQLWTSYLRLHEVAFFAKKDPKLPKLGAFFKKKDARIIYGLKSKPVRSTTSVTTGKSSVSSSKATRSTKAQSLARRKQQISLVNAEYETYQTDLETTLGSLSVNNLSASSFSTKGSSGSENSVRIEFSRVAKRCLKRKIPKKHLHKHEQDASLGCHSFKRSAILRNCYPEILTRSVLYEILYLALNQIEDDIQLGDIIRYLREGHISFYSVTQFIPSNVTSINSVNRTFNKASNLFPSANYVRFIAAKHMRALKVHMKVPDMSKLCRRYLTELCLPNDLHKMIDTILMVCPPEMKIKNKNSTEKLANYEGRAMAYIIFVLKLLFGLDNTREMQISASAIKINSKIKEFGLNKEALFVWSEWTKFIQMRNVILAQCHYPTSLQVDPNSTQTTHLYVHYLKDQEEKEEMLISDDKGKCHVSIENMDTVFKKLCKLHEIETEKPSFKFLPSLTPKAYLMNYLLNDHTMTQNIHIPEFMQQKFENTDILSYLKPSLLKSFFHEKDIKLTVNRLECNGNINFTDFFCSRYPKKISPYTYTNHLLLYNFDVTDEQWKEKCNEELNRSQETAAKQSEEHGALIASHLAFIEELREKCVAEKKLRKARIQNDKIAVNEILDESLNDIDQQDEYCIPLFDYDVSDDEKIDDGTSDDDNEENDVGIRFDVSNYDYWMNLGYTDELTREQFKLLQTKFPKHFNWLLEQCANAIECNARDVYMELLLIENQFAYVVEDFSKLSNIVLKQNPESYKRLPGLYKFIRFMQRRW